MNTPLLTRRRFVMVPLLALALLFPVALATTGQSLPLLAIAAALMIILLGVAAQQAYRRPLTIDWPVLLVMLLLGGWLTASTLWSISSSTTLVNSFWLSPLWLALLAYTLLQLPNRLWRWHLRLLLFMLLLSALYAIAQVLWFADDARSLFLNRNNHAALMNIGLLLLLSQTLPPLAVTPERRLSLIASLTFLTLFTAMLLAGSRGALISLLITAPVVVLLLWRRVSLRVTLQLLLLTATGLLFSEIISNGWAFERISSLQDPFAAGTTRLNIWRDALAHWREAPFIGNGFGTFWLLFPGLRNPETTRFFYYAHNDYLQLLLEGGIIALLLLFTLYLLLLNRFTALWRQRQRLPQHYFEATLLFAALLVVALHSFVTFNFYIMGIALLLGIITARLTQLCKPCTANRWQTRWAANTGRRPYQVIVILFTLLLLEFPVTMGLADHAKSRGSELLQQNQLKEAYHEFEQATQLASHIDVFYLLTGQFALDVMQMRPSDIFYSIAEENLKQCLAKNGYRIECILGLAQLYEGYGSEYSQPPQNPDELNHRIEELLRQAVAKDPAHPLVLARYGRFLLKQQRLDDAYHLLNGSEHYQFHGPGIRSYLQTYAELLQQRGESQNTILQRLQRLAP
ncbi:MAG: O-antigen ligase family protein [Gammaproteobacteria bacterium]|nr:O-antigen ligase family protein [Gammaproteobacteria bacterium]